MFSNKKFCNISIVQLNKTPVWAFCLLGYQYTEARIYKIGEMIFLEISSVFNFVSSKAPYYWNL